MPPAATNGIMYDTPVISHCRTLVPTPTLRVAAAAGRRRRSRRGQRRQPPAVPALGAFSTAATAAAMHAGAVVDGLLDADVDERLAGEPGLALDLEVGGVDDAVGGGDDVIGQRDGARRALGLDLDLVAGVLTGLLEVLGRHVGVRDARRA